MRNKALKIVTILFVLWHPAEAIACGDDTSPVIVTATLNAT